MKVFIPYLVFNTVFTTVTSWTSWEKSRNPSASMPMRFRNTPEGKFSYAYNPGQNVEERKVA